MRDNVGLRIEELDVY